MRATLVLILLALTLSVSTPLNAQGQKIRLTSEKAYVHTARWSPDGRLIALAVIGKSPAQEPSGVYLVTPEGKEVVRITDNVAEGDYIYSIDWSPNGKYLRFEAGSLATSDYYTVIASADGKILGLVKNEMPEIESGWLSDSQAYWKIDDERRHLFAIGLDGKEVKRSDETLYPDGRPNLSPDGTAFIVTAENGIVLIDSTTFKTITKLLDTRPGGFATWSPNGKLILAGIPNIDMTSGRAIILDRTGKQLSSIEITPNMRDFQWSPNSTIITVIVIPGKKSKADVVFYSTDGTIVGTAPLGSEYTNWTRDNTYLIVNPQGKLVSIYPDGTLAHDFGFGEDTYPIGVWSPDGKLLVLSSSDNMYIYNAEGNLVQKFKRLSDQGGFYWSPDSKSILSVEEKDGAWLYKVQ